MHMLAYDSGEFNAYGEFPIYHCSPLNQNPSCKVHGWSGEGVFLNRGQFCNFKVIKDAGKTCLLFEGYQLEKLVLTHNTCDPQKPSDLKEHFLRNNLEMAADRMVYKLRTDAGEDLYLDTKWWELPDEVQQDLELPLLEYSRVLNSLGASCPFNKIVERSRIPLTLYFVVLGLLLLITILNQFRCCGRKVFE